MFVGADLGQGEDTIHNGYLLSMFAMIPCVSSLYRVVYCDGVYAWF